MDLDEFSDEQLKNEILKREEKRSLGLCDYCGRGIGTGPCRFPDRHALARPKIRVSVEILPCPFADDLPGFAAGGGRY